MEAATALSSEIRIKIRFSEVDSMGIAWHGNYIKYFEDGREDFGSKFGLGYLDVHSQGFVIPIVKITCEYKKTIKYGDHIIIKSTFVNTPAAKLIFHYEIRHAESNDLIAKGESIQVFLNPKHELSLNVPEFFLDWKKKMGL